MKKDPVNLELTTPPVVAPPTLDPRVSIRACLTASPQDWGADHRTAWLYGIAVGWDEQALAQLAARHHWTAEAVQRLRLLRNNYEALR